MESFSQEKLTTIIRNYSKKLFLGTVLKKITFWEKNSNTLLKETLGILQ